MDSVTVSPTSVKNTDGKGLLEPRAKLEAHVGYCGCRKKAVKAEARPSQDLKVSLTYSLLPASLYRIPDGCPALSPWGLPVWTHSGQEALRDTKQFPHHECLS